MVFGARISPRGQLVIDHKSDLTQAHRQAKNKTIRNASVYVSEHGTIFQN